MNHAHLKDGEPRSSVGLAPGAIRDSPERCEPGLLACSRHARPRRRLKAAGGQTEGAKWLARKILGEIDGNLSGQPGAPLDSPANFLLPWHPLGSDLGS